MSLANTSPSNLFYRKITFLKNKKNPQHHFDWLTHGIKVMHLSTVIFFSQEWFPLCMCLPDSRASEDDCASSQMHAMPESLCAVVLADQTWQNQWARTLDQPRKKEGISGRWNKQRIKQHIYFQYILHISDTQGINLQIGPSWASWLVWQYRLSRSLWKS